MLSCILRKYAMKATDERYQINSLYQRQRDIDKASIKERKILYPGKTTPSNAPGRFRYHVWGNFQRPRKKKQTDAMFALTPGHILEQQVFV